MVRVQVPASTANMGPGFDCLGMALQLYNTIEVSQIPSGLIIEIFGEGSRNIPRDENNLVYKAVLRVFKAVGHTAPGLKIKLANNIPVARGLGSSTAAIVGGVIGANIISGGRLSQREIINLCCSMEGHPDNVAACVLGGIAVAVNCEGEVRCLKINVPPKMKAILAVPDFTLPTKTSREALPVQIPIADAIFNVGRVALLVASLQAGDMSQLGAAMEDKLHQPYRSGLVPGMKKVLAATRLAGARGVSLSGAGPSLVALADENYELIARVMKDTFKQNGVPAKTLVLEVAQVGARALEIK